MTALPALEVLTTVKYKVIEVAGNRFALLVDVWPVFTSVLFSLFHFVLLELHPYGWEAGPSSRYNGPYKAHHAQEAHDGPYIKPISCPQRCWKYFCSEKNTFPIKKKTNAITTELTCIFLTSVYIVLVHSAKKESFPFQKALFILKYFCYEMFKCIKVKWIKRAPSPPPNIYEKSISYWFDLINHRRLISLGHMTFQALNMAEGVLLFLM